MTEFSLWLDEPNALEQLDQRSAGNALYYEAGLNLIQNGWALLPAVQRPEDCDQARKDYAHYIKETPEADKYADENARHFRLTNFHLYSEAAMRIGKNPIVMGLLDFIFDKRAAVYTSLTFEYSTEQPLHRDVPYFYTFPEGQFVGAWSPLEDIHPDAGPLSYVPGSHRFSVDRHQFYKEGLFATKFTATNHVNALQYAIGAYNNSIYQNALAVGQQIYITPKIGDTFIWHPQLVHGGSPQKNPNLTRNSMVFHCCPENQAVYQDDVFFSWFERNPPPPRFQYAESHGRLHGDHGKPNFMNSR